MIQNVDPIEFYDPYKISIWVTKLNNIYYTNFRYITFESCTTMGECPSEWKMANVVPSHLQNSNP